MSNNNYSKDVVILTIGSSLSHFRLRAGDAVDHPLQEELLILAAGWSSVLDQIIKDAESPLTQRQDQYQYIYHLITTLLTT